MQLLARISFPWHERYFVSPCFVCTVSDNSVRKGLVCSYQAAEALQLTPKLSNTSHCLCGSSSVKAKSQQASWGSHILNLWQPLDPGLPSGLTRWLLGNVASTFNPAGSPSTTPQGTLPWQVIRGRPYFIITHSWSRQKSSHETRWPPLAENARESFGWPLVTLIQ